MTKRAITTGRLGVLALLASVAAFGCGSDTGSGGGGAAGAGGAASGGTSSGGHNGNTGGAGGATSSDCVKSGSINVDTTWKPLAACPDGFAVPATVAVNGAGTVLTVEPGTKLKFGAEASLVIGDSAALVAIGSEAKPITFTGWQELAGSWGGIVFHSSAVSNEISHAVVEYAGSKDGASGNIALSSDGNGRLKLSSTILRNGAKFGLTVLDGGALGEFSGNTITNNALGAARVDATAVDQLAGTGNLLEGNGKSNIVRIEASSLVPIVKDTTWPNLSPAIYQVTGYQGTSGTQIYVKAHLTLEAGSTYEFAGGSGIDVSDGASGLAAIGTAAAPIIFRGVDGSGWTGIGYCESGWTGNALESVEIDNAAGPPNMWSYCGSGSPGVLRPSVLVGHNFLANASQLRIKNVTFKGPNNAPVDLFVLPPSKLVQEGTNVGAGGPLKVSTN